MTKTAFIIFFAPAILFCASEWLDFFTESKTAYQLWRERAKVQGYKSCELGNGVGIPCGSANKNLVKKSGDVKPSDGVHVNSLSIDVCSLSSDCDKDGVVEVNQSDEQCPIFLEKMFEFFGRIAPWGVFGGYKANMPEKKQEAKDCGNDKRDSDKCSFFDDNTVDSNRSNAAFGSKDAERGCCQSGESDSRSGSLNCGKNGCNHD